MQTVVQLNAAPNTPVFTLQARDPDTDHNIHYFIVRDRTGGRFEVDERSGVVRTRGTDPFQLDMEYVLYVKAEDQVSVQIFHTANYRLHIVPLIKTYWWNICNTVESNKYSHDAELIKVKIVIFFMYQTKIALYFKVRVVFVFFLIVLSLSFYIYLVN